MTVSEPAVTPREHYSASWAEYTLNYSDITVNAVYNPTVYTVTFSDDSVQNRTVSYTAETIDQFTEPAPTERAHYRASWQEYALNYEDITVNAVYTAIVYTVTFADDLVNPRQVQYTAVNVAGFSEPAPTERERYTVAWQQYSLNYEDITVNAVYTPIVYSITFDDGTASTKVEYTVETQSIQEPAVTKLTGKSGEWEQYQREYTTTQVVQAIYTDGIFRITFTVDGSVYHTYKKAYDTAIDLPAENPVKEADAQYTYAFASWEGYQAGMKVGDGDMVFSAVFSRTVNSYNVTFTVGDSSTTSVLEYGTRIVLPESPSKDSTVDTVYTFLGWNGYTDSMIVTGNVEFTASFGESLRQYTVTFLNDDSSVISSGSVGYGLAITIPSASKTSTAQYDFVFDRWMDAQGQPIQIPQTVSGDFTAYAAYTQNLRQYVISYVADGQEYARFTLYYGNTVVKPAEDPSKASDDDYDYSFIGWSGYADGSKVTGNATYVAEFSKSVKVKTDGNGSYSVTITDTVASFTSDTIADIMEQAKDNASVTMSVSVGGGLIEFDNTALQSLDGKSAELVVNVLTEDQMTQSVKDIVGDNVAYSITFGSNKTFGNGNVTVTLPYKLDAGKDADKLMIYYIADGRVAEEMPCLYSNGYVTFVTSHFSTYAVMYVDPEDEQQFPVMYAAIGGGVAVLALAGVAILLIRRR